MDHNAGLVLDELAALGLEAKTVVTFLGDHAWQVTRERW
jgi:arylsulfatase A-like enzyme